MEYPPLSDILDNGLKVVFCGLNPGLKTAASGHHFMNKSNRFWKVLHLSGFTSKLIEPEDDQTILKYGCGLTTAVSRATARASQLSKGEFAKESHILEKKIRHYRPDFIAFLGKAAYAELSGKKDLEWGLQSTLFGGAKVWIVPNPSGLNRNFSLQELVENYTLLRQASQADNKNT